MDKIKVTFLIYEDEDNSIDWTSGKVKYLDSRDIYVGEEICSEVEVLVSKTDLKEIKKDSRGLDGIYHTYIAESLQDYTDGKETKYEVTTWIVAR